MLHDSNGLMPEFSIADRVLVATSYRDTLNEQEHSEYLPDKDGIHWFQTGHCKSLRSWEAA